MSKPRYGWWPYAKWMIRNYKGGGLMTKAERVAVEDAIAETEQLIDGSERLRLIDLVLWKRTHTLQGAALACYVSERTAQAIYSACGAKKGAFVKKSASQSQKYSVP